MGSPAARITDMHVCPMSTGPVPHVGGPILPAGEPTVLIGGLPAARVEIWQFVLVHQIVSLQVQEQF